MQNASSCSESPSAWPSGSDNNGNVAGYYYNDNANSGLSHAAAYSYDAVNRLVSAVATGNVTYSQTYTFTGDGSNGQYGNMSCAPAGPGCVAFTYSASTNQITTPGYIYGPRGNQNDPTYSYGWGDEGRMLSAVSNATQTVIATYTYNALMQRVRDVTQSETTDEVYGAGGALLWRYTGNSSSPDQRAYVPFNGGILAEYWSGGTLFDHEDELGSISTSTDYTGNNLAERFFYPYGELWTGIDLNSFNPHRTYAKQPDYDPEIDMYNDPHRHYMPSGRFPSPDPGGISSATLEDPQTWNRYAYARNNPTTLTDPSGLMAITGANIAGVVGELSPTDAAALRFWDNGAGNGYETSSEYSYEEYKAVAGPHNSTPQETENQGQTQTVVEGTTKLNTTIGDTKVRVQVYNLVELDSKGNTTPLPDANHHSLELRETAKGDTKGLDYCHGQCKSASGGKDMHDTWSVTRKNKGYSVTRRFYMDDKAVRIYDASTKKAYDWQNVQASYKGGFVVTYGNGRDPD